MKSKQRAKGSWGLRFFIVLLGIVLGILFYSILTFVETDIGTLKRPEWDLIRREFVSQETDDQREQLQSEVLGLKRKIDALKEQQRILSDSTGGLQKTLNQLLSIQKQMIEKGQELPPESVRTLRESQAAFLENQKQDQHYTQEISALIQQRQQKEQVLSTVLDTIRTEEEAAREEEKQRWETFRLKVAALKLAFLVPVFLAVSFFFMKYRSSAWWPLVWAGFAAAFIKIALVAHEYFPTRFFKYIAILVLLAIVLRILVVLIRMILSPKPDLLIRQYEEHYDKYRCPICGKPIRIGPLRYLGGLSKKQAPAAGLAADNEIRQPYTCPSCGTGLYDSCGHCGQIRHTLLPYCEHCGAGAETNAAEENTQEDKK